MGELGFKKGQCLQAKGRCVNPLKRRGVGMFLPVMHMCSVGDLQKPYVCDLPVPHQWLLHDGYSCTLLLIR